MKVIVTGSSGMLAGDLIPELEQSGIDVVRYDLPVYDITNYERSSKQIHSDSPSMIINCAAYTAVDKAETESQKAYAVNRDGAKNLAVICNKSGIPLIHISTDYVFDGRTSQPYRETDKTNPLNVYGKSKWEGEEAVRSALPEHLILRTAWLYGVHGSNFAKTILQLAREKEVLRIVNDQFGCPTWTGDLAYAIKDIIHALDKISDNKLWGTYHVCATGKTTWYGFACAIFDEARNHEKLSVREVIPITSKEYPQSANRPPMSALDTGKLTQTFAIHPLKWQEGLKRMLECYYGEN
ncbi:MAG: dTDP-4-dehydrorhamnose reductase [Candidatus Latescibacteria bacterium]|nr:dTDP-4-dehydrorhamnose reductase [Candidatus Latescibacterota bacterium]